MISGSMVRIKYNVVLNRAGGSCCPKPTAESNLNGRFEGPMKKDPAAMNSPKHIRQRCRAMRFAPRTPPRTSMRTSPAPASSITEPMKKVIPTGTPSCELAPLRTTFRPVIQVRIPRAERLGRGRRLGPNQRSLILDIYSEFMKELSIKRQFDARELARIACSFLGKGEPSENEYGAIIVDEVQDLSDIELRIVKMLGDRAGNLFLVGDGAQQIYRRGQSLKSIGINISGRSFVLRKNYRNAAEIIRSAMALKNAEGIGRFDEDPSTSQADAIPSAVSGERPALIICVNPLMEAQLVVREIRYLTKRLGFLPSQICCISRTAYVRDQMLKQLAAAGIRALDYRAEGVGEDDAVLVSTLHNVKGHEFRAVFILGVVEGALPLFSASEAEETEREAALLYVAMTRAKELLYWSYSESDSNGKQLKPSRFLSSMREHLDVLDFAKSYAAGKG